MIAIFVVVCSAATAQTPPRKQAAPGSGEVATGDQTSFADAHEKLMALLWKDRKVSAFVARDPQLLADHEFIQRNNPELAVFLDAHPEVTRNPEFYLFTETGNRLRIPLARSDWPDRPTIGRDVTNFIGAFLVFICLLLGVLWLVRTLLESRRWSRLLNVQTESQNRLLDKFGNSEELLAYLRSDVDKRLLPPIGMQLTPNGSSISNPVSRVLSPLQAGIVLAVVGAGFIGLRSTGIAEAQEVFAAVGIVVMALGVGFIAAAAAGWIMARHFGLLPDRSTAAAGSAGSTS